MNKYFVCFALFLAVVCCLSAIEAAPAPEQLLDWKTAIEKIISAYERRYPGPSKRYPIEVARVVDPNHLYLP
ncbi:uncharacterized protein LOC105218918 [Zeugodacus cucurbitae]|uniref:uncharacterized protein LOC105218918 n=1 Tax=Zeugodacus cucurbitae TaxID=28588 RepID=UPI000596AB10|nr:uncharacterized protein LOC105218918 [Zeugodacus cucurbitae]